MRLNATKEDIISFICLRWLTTTETINCDKNERRKTLTVSRKMAKILTVSEP